MSSQDGDRSLDEGSESRDDASMKPKISYTREFLLSISSLDICKKLPSGFDDSLLRFPNTCAGALDLLEKMLVFDPSKRITVDEALCHPYLAPLHDINEEPVCPRPFVVDFELPSFTEDNIKELIWRESVRFNPDPTH